MRLSTVLTIWSHDILLLAHSQAVAPSIRTATVYDCTTLPGAASQTCGYINDTPVCLTAPPSGLVGTTVTQSSSAGATFDPDFPTLISSSTGTSIVGSESSGGNTFDPNFPPAETSTAASESLAESTVIVVPVPQESSTMTEAEEGFITLPVPQGASTSTEEGFITLPVPQASSTSTDGGFITLPMPQASSTSTEEGFITLPVPNSNVGSFASSSTGEIIVDPILISTTTTSTFTSTSTTSTASSAVPSSCASLAADGTTNTTTFGSQTFSLQCDSGSTTLSGTEVPEYPTASSATSFQACLDACAVYFGETRGVCVGFGFVEETGNGCVVLSAGGETVVRGAVGVVVEEEEVEPEGEGAV